MFIVFMWLYKIYNLKLIVSFVTKFETHFRIEKYVNILKEYEINVQNTYLHFFFFQKVFKIVLERKKKVLIYFILMYLF